MAEAQRTGQHRNPDRDPKFFTTAYFHDREAIAGEMADSGLRPLALLPIEGPRTGHRASGTASHLTDPEQQQLVLDSLAAIENDPAMTGATAHILAIGQHT